MRDILDVRELLTAKDGDLFLFRGYEYKAQSEAIKFNSYISLKACRREIGSKSSYFLADILELCQELEGI